MALLSISPTLGAVEQRRASALSKGAVASKAAAQPRCFRLFSSPIASNKHHLWASKKFGRSQIAFCEGEAGRQEPGMMEN